MLGQLRVRRVDLGVVAIGAADGAAELIGYREPIAGNYKVLRGGSAATIVSGRPLVGDGVIVRQASGTLALYLSDDQGVVTSSSTDGGATWSAPAATGSHDVGDVQSVAVRPDGTTLYSQDGTGFVKVFTGPAGGPTNVFPSCCGYAETLAVDTGGLTQIAFWSNATGQSGYLYGPVGGPYQNLSGSKESLSNDARVPLVADAAGNAFLAWQTGYPEADAFIVWTYRGGSLQHSVRFTGKYPKPDPHMALGVDASNRLWAVWTRQKAVWAARSRSHGAHFGAAVHVAEPGSVYQLEAGARPDGSVDVVANTGSSLQSQRLLPGLTVTGSRSAARVLDDGFPLAGVTLRGGGRTLHTNAQGRASLAGVKPHTALSVTTPGYAPAAFRVP